MSAQLHGRFIRQSIVAKFGLSIPILRDAIQYTHEILDQIDRTLLQAGSERITSLVELANLSAILGNLFRSGVIRASKGVFKANSPHTFPDLLAVKPNARDLEIKVALEQNNPKGHLAKPGPHVIVRYVLGSDDGHYTQGKHNRGNVAWVWEVRVGVLNEQHFNISNTSGDSGKTAVINHEGMNALKPVFLDFSKCPYSHKGPTSRALITLYESKFAGAGYSRSLPQP